MQAPKELTLSVLRRKRDFSRGFSTRVPNTPTKGAERTAADLMGFAHCRRPPCCWFLDVCFLAIFSLLKCVLARWFLDVSFQVTSFMHNVKFGDGFCYFGAQDLSFGRPGAFILAPWGTILAPWAIVGDHGSSRKDTSESGIGFLSLLGRFRDPILKAFWVPRAKILCFFRACFQVTFCTGF